MLQMLASLTLPESVRFERTTPTFEAETVPAGLLLYGARQELSGAFGTGTRRNRAVEKFVTPVTRWLQDFL